MQEVKDYAEMYTIEEWEDIIECGAITPYDGTGYPAKFENGKFIEDDNQSCWNYKGDFTHIAWYNK